MPFVDRRFQMYIFAIFLRFGATLAKAGIFLRQAMPWISTYQKHCTNVSPDIEHSPCSEKLMVVGLSIIYPGIALQPEEFGELIT